MNEIPFNQILSKWFTSTYGNPTEIQKKAWDSISNGNHSLLISPTGSGKTFAAFFWALNQLISGSWKTGETSILYISPLKALNTDIRLNLLQPLFELNNLYKQLDTPFPIIRISTRSADTPQSARLQMRRHPPEILITTPESLGIMLSSQDNLPIFSKLKAVILDEMHYILPTKRGTYTISCLEILTQICPEFQRIGMSATISDPALAAHFFGGYKYNSQTDSYEQRNVSIIQSTINKKYEAKVDFNLPENKSDPYIYSTLVTALKKKVADKNSSIIFVNSRRMAEKLARLLNENESEPLVYAHHGSLSREYRFEVEQKLKSGQLKAIVATNSLELGIDIGHCEQVLIVETPFSISSTLQRIGRAGHSVTEISRGYFYPIHPMDFISTDCIINSLLKKELEPTKSIMNPLDVLSQIVCLCLLLHPWNIDQLFCFIRTIYSYQTLTKEHFENVILMLSGYHKNKRLSAVKPRIYLDMDTKTLYPFTNLRIILYQSGGTIPDRGYYDLINMETKSKIGVLDEEFVWERKLHDTFAFGSNVWMVTAVTSAHIEVQPVSKAPDIIPFWKAEEQYRDFFLSYKFGEYLEKLEKTLGNANNENNSINTQSENLFKDTTTSTSNTTYSSIENYKSLIKLQLQQTGVLPGSHTIIVEYSHLYTENKIDLGQCIIIHCIFGNKINKPLSLLIENYFLSKNENSNLKNSVIATNNGILILNTHDFSLHDFFLKLSVTDYVNDLTRILLNTPLFGSHFRENSARALLLTKNNWKQRIPLWWNRVRSRKLFDQISQFPNFPIIVETFRSCINDQFDMDNMINVIDQCIQQSIRIHEVHTDHPSPFSKEILWNYTNIAMYEKDILETKKSVNHDKSLLNNVLMQKTKPFSIHKEVLEIHVKKLQCLLPDYIPLDVLSLLTLAKNRVLIQLDEWKLMTELCNSIIITSINNGNKHNTYNKTLTVDSQIEFINSSMLFLFDAKENSIFILHKEIVPQLFRSLKSNIALFSYDHSARYDKNLYELFFMLLNPNNQYKKKILQLSKKYRIKPIYDDFNKKPMEQFTDTTDKNDIVSLLDDNTSTEDIYPKDLFLQWLSFYTPLALNEVYTMLPLKKETIDSIIDELINDNTILMGNLLSEYTQICESKNFYNLIRTEKQRRRSIFKPFDSSVLPLFLAYHQGIIVKAATENAIQSRIDQLFGYPADVGAWESYILPNRIDSYHTSILDALMNKYDLLWYGCSEKNISFNLPELLPICKTDQSFDYTSLSSLMPSSFGKFSFYELLNYTNIQSDTLTSKLWQLVWEGILSNTSMEVIRKGYFTDFSFNHSESSEHYSLVNKPSYTSWVNSKPTHGYWFVLPKAVSIDSEINVSEIIKQRIRILLKRYGIIFRDLLIQEQSIFNWSSIIDTLRLMELSGEILGGYFIKGIAGIQFCLPEIINQISELDFSTIYWINACDPACIFHLEAYKSLIPDFRRIPSTYIVMKGNNPILILKKKGQELYFNTNPDDKNILHYLSVFNYLVYKSFDPITSITVLAINNTPSLSSEYANILLNYGFEKGYKGLEFRGKIK